MHALAGILAFLGFGASPPAQTAPPPHTYRVQVQSVAEQKSVFATVEPSHRVAARTRIGGTIAELDVHPGDHVERGAVIALVADQKLALQTEAYAAQLHAAQTKLKQAKAQLDRARHLITSRVVSQSEYDEDETNYTVALGGLKAAISQKAVLDQQIAEGKVLAPVAGRILTAPMTTGSVVTSGETVATIAEDNFVLRLEIPEQNARTLKLGERVRVGTNGYGPAGFGSISLIYPQIDNGRVVADAVVAGIGNFFVGQRIGVEIAVGSRSAIVVPQNLITTRAGIDYARLWTPDAGALDVPVQRGEEIAQNGKPPALEILSGLKAGDRLLPP